MSIKIKPVALPQLSVDLEANGPEGDERCWLTGAFDMWGARFNLELYRVIDLEDEQHIDIKPVDGHHDWVVDFGLLDTAHQPDGGFDTIDLDGETYAVFIYPASRS